jgi:hypothetical protein
LDLFKRQQDAEREIERITKQYRPNTTSGFNLQEIQFLRILGHGMTGTVSLTYFINDHSLMNILVKNEKRIFLIIIKVSSIINQN